MASPVPPPKRRRLDNASALSKPFRSPLKASTASVPTDTTAGTAPPPTPERSALSTKPVAQSHSSPNTPTHPAKPTFPTKFPKPSPELLALRSKHASLQSTLSASRQALDTALQAQKLENSNTDVELERLITKWRRASRDAAEEVFAETRDRVNKMGGVRGWKEREREGRERTREFQREWDGEGEKARRGDGDEGDGEDRDGEGQGEREERKFAEEEDGCGEVRKEEEEVVDEDEGFTMDMMLRSLNIDLDIIGFDKKSQRWKE